MAEEFKERVQSAQRNLDDTTPLKATRTWYRNGTRGSLHSNRHCYKLNTWGSTQLSCSIEDAVKKRVCRTCGTFAEVVNRDTARVVEQLVRVELHIALGETEITRSGTQDLGNALASIEAVEQTLAGLSETETDLAGKAIERFRQKITEMRDAVGGKADQIKDTAIVWAAASMARRIVILDETAVPGKAAGDLVIFGENHSTKHQKLDMLLGRIYLRWCRGRENDEETALNAALKLLEEAELRRPEQLDFPLGKTSEDGATLLDAVRNTWKRELLERLTGRLIPAWENVYSGFVSRTEPVIVGLGDEVTRNETRSLLAAHPGAQSGTKRLGLVPAIVGDYIATVEKSWRSDTVETAPGCEPELLDTVVALWDPHSRDSEFRTLEAAAVAARAV